MEKGVNSLHILHTSTASDALTRKSQDILTRVINQERENANIKNKLQILKQSLYSTKETERVAFAEVTSSMQEVLSLCLLCLVTSDDDNEEEENNNNININREELITEVVQELTQYITEEEEAMHTFKLEAQHTQVEMLTAEFNETKEEKSIYNEIKELEIITQASEAEAERERNEIMQLEQERVELERRTELATLKLARELFDVQIK